MTLPPFPSQDLAKLVLGYLAEEQLMTAYDEFLQASPYLDALRNEYDRIFMTSLKIILAEYRAVKIYVETCKPFVLRKKLLQCPNLLDIVKLLVNYVDVNKLHVQDTGERNNTTRQDISSASKQNCCDTCTSLNLTTCTCQTKPKQVKPILHPACHVDGSSLQKCVEATVLEDLPGSYSTVKKKHLKVLEKESTVECNIGSGDNRDKPERGQSDSGLSSSQNALNYSQSALSKSNEHVPLNSLVKAPDLPVCGGEKIEEFNNILNNVCNDQSNTDTRLCSISESEHVPRRTSNSRFQSFVAGVGGNDSRNVPVPDSSTSESSITVLNNSSKDTGDVQNEVPQDVTGQSGFQPIIPTLIPRKKPMCTDQKIKILSDIKVDHPFPKLNNATSTPLMQTIVINGTPAYKQKLSTHNTYTKDEIMAMPTIIVVPTSGPPKKDAQAQSAMSQKIKKTKKIKTPSTTMLEPLVIDVSSSPVMAGKDSVPSQAGVSLKSSSVETGLVKTVDVVRNASVPKNVTISGTTQTITPEVLPPERKSSSTPRRNSHIRVLDFATPRRILCDTIPEEPSNKPVEVVVAGSPNIVYPEPTKGNNIIDMSTVKVHKIETCHISSTDENKQPNKNNWDAKLRALAVSNAPTDQPVVKKVRKAKRSRNKPDNTQEKIKDTDATDSKKSRSKRKISPKGKKAKRRKMEEEEESYSNLEKGNANNVAIKPTFNIVQGERLNTIQETAKSNVETSETPEEERIALQNELGAKLNISDLLETPYKQALYDIQMDTPKFIGSVLPDEPISDIKIMNIPTPRFFDTPKPMQATPSYSSRATDYSSGGSYYKPDEQDYLRIPDIEVAVTSSTLSNEEPPKETDRYTKKNVRPVRRCTKNVSYRAQTNKGKSIDDVDDVASSCSDITSMNSSLENNQETVKTPKTPRVSKPKSNFKSEKKKKMEPTKTRKSPTKKEKSNAFMKIKPRRPTPIKDNKRTRKSVTLAKSPRQQIKKKANGKDKVDHVSPTVTCAPTKSRRKSSTPRKLHCTKQINSESSVDSPEQNRPSSKLVTREQTIGTTLCPDSDNEQLALRWSDDCSQESKTRGNECEDISKIKEYIELSLPNKSDYTDGKGTTLQVDLIKRGFDAETAKIIERDLLDTPEQSSEVYVPDSASSELRSDMADVAHHEKSDDRHTSATVNNILSENEPTEDDLELSISECNEESSNYVIYNSETKDPLNATPVTLRDAWSMEVCIDDDVTIRLRATSFNILFDNSPQDVETGYCFRETEVAVSSITNIESLYTPLKDRRSQCYEIFDSTLTSLDTPLKATSPKYIHQSNEIEIAVEEETLDNKDASDDNKRKLLQVSNTSEETVSEVTKTKSEAQFSFGSANIQNIDIESVLEKLHGP